MEINEDAMIDRIMDWADDNPWFDTDFIESLQEQLEARDWLTDAQTSALDNIINKFDID